MFGRGNSASNTSIWKSADGTNWVYVKDIGAGPGLWGIGCVV